MKQTATFLRISSNKIEVTGEQKPQGINYWNATNEDIAEYELRLSVFEDSFIKVENPEVAISFLSKVSKEAELKRCSTNVGSKDSPIYAVPRKEYMEVKDGLYPIQCLEFEIKDVCSGCGADGFIEETKKCKTYFRHCCEANHKVATVSLIGAKEVEDKLEENFSMDFIKWYSGMNEVKIRHAYERYCKEVLKH